MMIPDEAHSKTRYSNSEQVPERAQWGSRVQFPRDPVAVNEERPAYSHWRGFSGKARRRGDSKPEYPPALKGSFPRLLPGQVPIRRHGVWQRAGLQFGIPGGVLFLWEFLWKFPIRRNYIEEEM